MKINDKLIKKDILTASLNSDMSVSTTSGLITVSKSVSTGNRLTLSNGKIVIGKGIKKVKVCANMRIYNSSTSKIGVNMNIYKNSIDYVASNRTTLDNNSYDGISVATSLIEVEENDELSIHYWKSNESAMTIMKDYGGTYLTVEVAEYDN